MKIKIIYLVFSVFFIISCGKKTEKNIDQDKLIKIWATDSLLTTCESVIYDKNSEVIYVSNINGNPWEEDNNGFISTLNTKGEITNLKWLEGLSAPKGMGLSKGKLYVNDINNLIEIDIATQTISNTYHIEGNPQLNDITVSPNGIVYSSGSNSNIIYKLENGKIETELQTNLERLNGLFYDNNEIYYLDFNTYIFGKLDLNNNSTKTLSTGINKGDGIVRLKNGDFILSGWKGEIYYVFSKDWTTIRLLDTKKEGVNAADIDFIEETKQLLVPTFFNNRVVSYKLNI